MPSHSLFQRTSSSSSSSSSSSERPSIQLNDRPHKPLATVSMKKSLTVLKVQSSQERRKKEKEGEKDRKRERESSTVMVCQSVGLLDTLSLLFSTFLYNPSTPTSTHPSTPTHLHPPINPHTPLLYRETPRGEKKKYSVCVCVRV